MPKIAFVDIGELGWSFYLSAHIRWLKERHLPIPSIAVFPGREALYEGLAPTILAVPKGLCEGIGRPQEQFGFYGMTDEKVRNHVNSRLPMGHIVSEAQPLGRYAHTVIFKGQMLFAPYPYKATLEGKKEILVFPRARMAKPFNVRNLSKSFYVALINQLCETFGDLTVRTIGTKAGAYDISEVERSNYINFVGKTPSIQEVIDRCQLAVASVGGTSSLPKLAMIQGVPSFIIGHEPKRFTKDENWMKTKVGFYPVPLSNYGNVNTTACINRTVDFIRSCL